MSARWGDILRYFSYAMVLVYVLLGGYVVFSPLRFSYLATWPRIGLGSVLAFYGLYRFYRLRKQYHHEDQS